MSKYRKYKPYIRRLKSSDMSEDLRAAARLGMLPHIYPGRQLYVLVQHGVPVSVMDVQASKHEIKKSILAVAIGHMTFKEWQVMSKKYAQGETKWRK